MRCFALVGLFAAAFPLFASPVLAATLFSFTTWQGGSQPGQVTSMTFPIQYAGSSYYYQNAIFLNDTFTQADVGKAVTITSGSDPNFNAFASEKTDGIPESIVFWFIPAPAVNISGQGIYESDVVWGDQNDPRVDLQIIASLPKCKCGGEFTLDAGPKCLACGFQFKQGVLNLDLRAVEPHAILIQGAEMLTES